MGERGAWVILFLMLVSGALAMEDPIVVEANAGDLVKIYIWPAEYGPALNIVEGVCDENGVFVTTFFSLNVEDVKYQVAVYDGDGDRTHSETFEDYGIASALKVDCTLDSKCLMSVMTDAEVLAITSAVEEVVINESVEVVDEVAEVVSISVENDSVEVVAFEENSQEEKSWFVGAMEGEFFLYLIGGVLTFVVFMVMWFSFGRFRGWFTRLNYFSEEGELARIEARIKRKEKLIDKIKKNDIRKEKIKAAKKKLKEEDEKLERMIRNDMKKDRKK